MMPINLEDIPAFLSGYQNIISTCARLLRGHNGKRCFLTVHESIVPAGLSWQSWALAGIGVTN